MKEKEVRTARFDGDLNIEAYQFQGLMQKFPNHFHEYYVVGFIAEGARNLFCKHREYRLGTGDLLLFNPRDNHACQPIEGSPLDYCCLNIQPEVMEKTAAEITGRRYRPYFEAPVVGQSDLIAPLRELHAIIMRGENDFKKEELYFFLLERLIEDYAAPEPLEESGGPGEAVSAVCRYLENNYAQNIKLDDLSALTGLSKYHLLRLFTRQKGISPYSYLETIRIGQAKKLLESGCPPIEAALQTGFSDQSHFSNFFKKFIGLTPGQYLKIFTKPNFKTDE